MCGFGWVVVHLDGIDADELSEPALDAWYLTAPEELVAAPPSPARSAPDLCPVHANTADFTEADSRDRRAPVASRAWIASPHSNTTCAP